MGLFRLFFPDRVAAKARRGGALRCEPLEGRYLLTGEIQGMVYHDADRDGTQDAGEVGQAGWTIYSDANNNGMRNASELAATTTTGGGYSLAGLAAGRHTVRLAPRYGQTPTQPQLAVRYVEISSGVAPDQNFGVAAPTAAPLPNFSLSDVNPATSAGGPVSPRDYLGRVSAWYFIHST
jgi:hypothetical protein